MHRENTEMPPVACAIQSFTPTVLSYGTPPICSHITFMFMGHFDEATIKSSDGAIRARAVSGERRGAVNVVTTFQLNVNKRKLLFTWDWYILCEVCLVEYPPVSEFYCTVVSLWGFLKVSRDLNHRHSHRK